MPVHSQGSSAYNRHLTRGTQHQAETLLGIRDSTYQRIVQNALEVTGVRIVALVRFDPSTQSGRNLAWAGQPLNDVQQAFDLIHRVLPGWDPTEVDYSAHANPLVEAAYLRGQSVSGPFRKFVEGSVHMVVAVAGEKILGLREGLLCPLMDGDQVWGALGFYGSRVLTEQERRVCEAFVREASLTVQNAHLVEQVQAQVRHLQEARQRVTAAEERQRQEIAELLHSRVQSSLLLTWSKLNGARALVSEEPERALVLIAEAQDDLARIRENEIRQASYLLHPSIIRVGLVPALRSLAARFDQELKVSVVAEAGVSELDDPLNNHLREEFRMSVFRIVEEALNNVQRHAAAPRAVVTIGIENETALRVEITDDGRGFDPAQYRPGLGLTVIGSRVEQQGGEWSVTSSPGHGASLQATLPLSR